MRRGAGLGAIVSLRVMLWDRGLRQRGPLARVMGWAAVVAGIVGLLVLGSFVRGVGGALPPDLVLRLAVVLCSVAPLLLVTDAMMRVGQGAGLGPALYAFPLTPRLIHLGELAAALASPAILGATVTLFAVLRAAGGGLLASGLSTGTFLGFLLCVALMLRLGAMNLLRRRFLRELALVGSTLVLLGMWLGAVSLTSGLGGAHLALPMPTLPSWVWFLPPAWFVAPAAPAGMLPAGAGLLGFVSAPLLVVAAFLLGAWLQDLACHGEADGLLARRSPTRSRRRSRWLDRGPLRLVHPAIWSTAGKEIKTMARDPFLMLMLVSQAVLLLVLPLLWRSGLLGGRGAGGLMAGYMPFFVLLLVMAKQTPVFNQVAMEGRGLLFLAQVPVPRWMLVLGKNLAYAVTFGLFDAGFMTLAAFLFDELARLPFYLAMAAVALVLMLGLGNLVSVLLPAQWVGARAAAGGTRAAQSAAEGGVERPGMAVILGRMVAVQILYMLLLPPILGMYVARWWLEGGALVAAGFAVGSYCLAIYVMGTAVAVTRFAATEDRLRARFASRAAA